MLLFFVINPQLTESQILSRRSDTTQRVPDSMGEQVLNHRGSHRFGSRPNPNETTSRTHTVLGFVIRLFAARRHKHFDNFHTINQFSSDIKQAHRRRHNIFSDAILDFQHIAVNVRYAYGFAAIINTNINDAALSIIAESDDFLFNVEFVGQFALEFDAVGFSHNQC